MRRLLIISCSQAKRRSAGLMPAIDRYDGPAFRVLRKFLRETSHDRPVVLILSGRHGLIDSKLPIRYYDLPMSAKRADSLRPATLERLARVLTAKDWDCLALCLSARYRKAVHGLERILPQHTRFEVLDGGLGSRLTRLHQWLRVPSRQNLRGKVAHAS